MPPFGWRAGVAMVDMVRVAAVHRRANLLAEAGRARDPMSRPRPAADRARSRRPHQSAIPDGQRRGCGYLPLEEVLAAKPEMTHVTVTGRNAPDALIEAADLATEMTLVKQPFREQGVKAQAGVEF